MLNPTFRILLLSLTSILTASAATTYENAVISRNYDLGGSLTSISTTYNVKAFTSDSKTNGGRKDEDFEDYKLILGNGEEEENAFWEVSVGGKKLDGLTVIGGGQGGE